MVRRAHAARHHTHLSNAVKIRLLRKIARMTLMHTAGRSLQAAGAQACGSPRKLTGPVRADSMPATGVAEDNTPGGTACMVEVQSVRVGVPRTSSTPPRSGSDPEKRMGPGRASLTRLQESTMP